MKAMSSQATKTLQSVNGTCRHYTANYTSSSRQKRHKHAFKTEIRSVSFGLSSSLMIRFSFQVTLTASSQLGTPSMVLWSKALRTWKLISHALKLTKMLEWSMLLVPTLGSSLSKETTPMISGFSSHCSGVSLMILRAWSNSIRMKWYQLALTLTYAFTNWWVVVI